VKRLTDSSELWVCPPLPLQSLRGDKVKHRLRAIPGSFVSQKAGLVALLFVTLKPDAVLYVGTDSSTSTFSHRRIQGTQPSLHKTLTSGYPPGSVKFQAGTTGSPCQTCTILTCWHSGLKTSDQLLASLFRHFTSLSLGRFFSN